MATTNQHAGDWDAADVPVVPTQMGEAQFEAWAFANRDVRAEWVDGKVVIMSPVSRDHAAVSIWLTHLLSAFLEARPLGELLGPEFMIRLGDGKSRRVPDLLFVCDARRRLVNETFLDGAPDVAIEIVSRDSQSRDRREKYLEYEAAGVREYWIVDPLSQRFEAYRLSDGGKFAPIDEQDGKFHSTVLDGFYLRNDWLWATPRPTVKNVLKELGID
ncbi:MAG: Uma2 family endonuclease [Pirellulales bacterium]